jgi:hypothetical protein
MLGCDTQTPAIEGFGPQIPEALAAGIIQLSVPLNRASVIQGHHLLLGSHICDWLIAV